MVFEAGETLPPGLEDASEDEPWWRIMGGPLAKVWAGEIGAQGMKLQFRADTDNPRVLVLEPSGSEVKISLDPMNRS